MKTVLRAVVTLVATAGIALAGASGAAAADPTLGASIQSRVYVAESRDLLVWNRSGVRAVFTFYSTSSEWTVTPATITLDPDEHSSVQVGGDGSDDVAITISVSSEAAPPPGTSAVALSFQSFVAHTRPWDASSLIAPAFYVLVALVVVLAVLRRLRPWEWRVTRVAS
jgi:hypothetical protein